MALFMQEKADFKVATSGPFRCKKTSKTGIFDAIILSKNGVVRSKKFMFSEHFRTFKPCSTTYFREVSAHVSLKAISWFFRSMKHKNGIFDAIDINQKQKSPTKVVDVFLLTF